MADSALTMRFHSLVFAIATNTPSTVIDYTMSTGKVHSLAKEYSLPCKPINEINSEFIFENINQQLLENRNVDNFHRKKLLFSTAMSKYLESLNA
jgi:polysaccharide pyruvyl transferase WcaK-like protein